MKTATFGLQKAIFVLVFLLAASCCRQEEKITIISTNDIHAAIDRFPNLATVVEQYRSQGEILLIDAGDRWTGNPYVDRADELGRPIIDLLNTLDYDLGTLGNHEFDHGMEILAERVEQSTFQNILANADFTDTPMPEVLPYTFRTVGGVKLAFLGLITTATNGHPAGKDEVFGNSVFFDPIETAVKYRSLRDSADVFVVISHAGLDVDTLIARAVPEIDLIIGGHTHDILGDGGMKVGDVLITQTGSRLRYAGVTTITTRGGKVKSVENKLVRLDEVEQSPRFVELVKDIKSYPELARTAGSTVKAMNETMLMNLFADLMREGTDSEIGFFNMGSMRIDYLPEGNISVGDIFAAEPFRNSPMIHYMTLEEIKDIILRKFNSVGGESHSVDIYPSGMTYTIITDGQGEATDIIFHEIEEVAGKKYKVAMSDYMDSQYDFDQRGQGVPTGLMITDLAFNYLEKNSPIDISDRARVDIMQNM